MNANVTASPIDYKSSTIASSKTDTSGGFELHLLAGVTYVIRAGIRMTDGFRQAETVVVVDQQTEGVCLSIRP